MRKSIVVALAVLVVAACGQVPRSGPQPGDQVLFIANREGVSAIDASTHATLSSLPPGVASPDWNHYFTVSGSLLRDLDPMTGATQGSFPLPAPYVLPIVTSSGLPGGLSPDGHRLVLQAPGASHLLVIDTSLTLAPQRIDLAGDFTFDAVSDDGERVYLIQHAANGHYFVRDYVFGLGLDPQIIFDKSDGTLAMSGVRLMGVPSPDGSWLYSVYAREKQSAFIHELNLAGPIALCVDLVGPGYAAAPSAMHWSLAMSGEDGRLYAVNGTLGVVTVLTPPNAPDTGRTSHLTGLSGSTSAVLAAGGTRLAVAGQGGVRLIDVNSLATTASALASWTVVALAPGAGGKTIYAISDSGQVAAIDSSGHVTSTFDSAVAQPIALLSVQRFS